MITNNTVMTVMPERRRLQELAEKYQMEGYTVLVGPSKEDLPDFMRYFHPDLIATRPDRSVAVEVRTPGKVRRVDYWREFSGAVLSHPNWHLEVLTNVQPEEQAESISQEEIEDLLRRSSVLAQQKEMGASLLIGWSAAEAAMRLVAERFNLTATDLRPQSLVSRLFSEGLLDREDYDFLLTCSRQRNAIAHGFRQTVEAGDLARLHSIIQKLLTE